MSNTLIQLRLFGWSFLVSMILPSLDAATMVQVAREPQGPWKEYPTRTLADIPELAALRPDAGLSQYGGWKARRMKATGFFYPTRVDGRWWLVDPEGCLFLHKGIAAVSQLNTPGALDARKRLFGTEQDWAATTTRLMRAHGFNGLGAWSDTQRLREVNPPLVYTRIWNFMSSYGHKRGGIYQKSGHMGYPNDCIFVFDPEFETFCDQHARQLVAQKDDPWLLGHFSDNELPLWRTSLRGYLKYPESDHGHQAALKWLRERHGPDATTADITEQDEKDFLGVVADRYFRIVSTAIKKHDPNHLFLGSRINGRATTYPEIFKAARPYLDVVAVNYYWAWSPEPELVGMWARESARPILITEWYAKGMDSGLPNRSGAGWIVKTQADRGRFYQNFTLGLLESKVCVGWDWFKYIDNDPDAKGVDPSNVDSNKGIVSNRYRPYRPLLDAMKQVNERVYGLADNLRHPPTASAGPTPRQASQDKVERQVSDLLARMTLEEKIGQMMQVDTKALSSREHIAKYYLGSVLSGASSDPADNLPGTWLDFAREMQSWALKTRLQIPLLYGIDAVHGQNNVEGAVIFPHNIGLGATRNPALVQQAAQVTAREVAGTGMHWAFAPCVAVAQDLRWGRTYESFSASPDVAGELGAAAVRGFQTPLPGGFQLLACAKHFVGDGGTHGGRDQGDTLCDEPTLRTTHLAPYRDAIEAGVGSIMVSYSSWNGMKMHGHKQLLTDVLKGDLGFGGFLVSDWAAIDQLPGDYRSDIKTSINAGLDMIMIPYGPGRSNNYVEFVTLLAELAASGEVSAARMDDAVRRILIVKHRMGLFDHPQANPALVSVVGSAEHRAVARECVRQSLVLLKNERQALPLSADVRHLVVVGDAADDVGLQCGGWTISHQGRTGAQFPGGTSILTALRDALGAGTRVTQSLAGVDARGADAILVVVGEAPYAEGRGDRQDLRLKTQDLALIQQAKRTGAPVITVVLSGRPLVLESALENSDALIAAWLPGTEGQGVADVLLGGHAPTGKLPVHWPRDNTQLAVSALGDAEPLFPLGFGLTYPKRARTTSLSGPDESPRQGRWAVTLTPSQVITPDAVRGQ